ncbi:MAG TPA: GPP34 family phosphoprotein [Tangfeifania sp.]|nr:GPP34 family phosphoprotein [Tangfeifania sp.]
MDKSLSLSEKIYLLAIHPQKGGIITPARAGLNYVLTGSLLLELYLEENIVFENKRIIVKNAQTKNPLHRLLLDRMTHRKKPLKISHWVSKFSYKHKKTREHLQKTLSEKRMLRQEDKHFLFFRWKKPALVNKQAVYQLQSEIENNVFKGTADKAQIMLLSLLKPAGLMKRLFPEKEKRRKASKRLKMMTVENQVSAAVGDAISAAQAVAASVAATTAVTVAAASN